MNIVGLTGLIGSGKTTAAQMIRSAGVPVFCADDAVHALYTTPLALRFMLSFCPDAVQLDGTINRAVLAATVTHDDHKMKKLEQFVHPLVRAQSLHFITAQRAAGAPRIVLDIPLLFETGRDKDMDEIWLVVCDEKTQQQRVLQRPGMTMEKLNHVLQRQWPVDKKRARATHIIDNNGTLDDLKNQILTLLQTQET